MATNLRRTRHCATGAPTDKLQNNVQPTPTMRDADAHRPVDVTGETRSPIPGIDE